MQIFGIYQQYILFDEEQNLEIEMDICKIEALNFNHSGSSNFSNLIQKQKRFENMIASIINLLHYQRV